MLAIIQRNEIVLSLCGIWKVDILISFQTHIALAINNHINKQSFLKMGNIFRYKSIYVWNSIQAILILTQDMN